ncbi:hypothetical protein [Roseateles sp. DC23W]|uniref:hypothetical protein n=1 Tax=Pelomonas dachongensis TaxID=3299029 RepID=UPI00374892AD
MKKNYLMSMWLSAANAALGHGRAKATQAVRRQTATATNQAKQQIADFWFGGLGAKPQATRRAKPKRKP